ncbi:MAG TPA: YHS domain-containing (seleno)protein, partial [Candidatus Binataceae bacterium]|nr:YHS domain-containing (seleno)protein [Candidatus Binataceae bacterium]
MATVISRRFKAMLVAASVVIAVAIASAGQQTLLAVDSNHVAIKGYDPVAYFTDRKAVKGDSRFEYTYDDAKWQFANAAHRDLFIGDPDHYMPQYGGFCAACVAMKLCSGLSNLAPADPEAWTIVDGKLYMVASRKFLAQWKVNSGENIRQAN